MIFHGPAPRTAAFKEVLRHVNTYTQVAPVGGADSWHWNEDSPNFTNS